MSLKDDSQGYLERWKTVEEVQTRERCTASLGLRWQQLNAAYAMAKGLGLLHPDPIDQASLAYPRRFDHPEICRSPVKGFSGYSSHC